MIINNFIIFCYKIILIKKYLYFDEYKELLIITFKFTYINSGIFRPKVKAVNKKQYKKISY